MKIRTLNLVAFGKFKNKIIELDDGFNLIFGRNEAGKTTIQHFIEGMFFGFYKPYRKKRAFSEAYYRYKPWHSPNYFGIMILEDDQGQQIRIERDFLKTRDGVRIYDNLTGDDISDRYPYDGVTKQYLPLGNSTYNATLYNNTVNIKQSSSATGPELAKEVNDRLVDLVMGSEDNLSVNQVLNYVEQQKNAIGSPSRGTSAYGRVLAEIQEQEARLEQEEHQWDTMVDHQQMLLQLQKTMDEVQRKIKAMESDYDGHCQAEKIGLQEKMKNLEEEVHKMQSELEDNDQHQLYDPKIFAHLKILEGNFPVIEERLNQLETNIENLSAEKNKIEEAIQESIIDFGDYSMSEIEDDYASFKQMGDQCLTAEPIDEELFPHLEEELLDMEQAENDTDLASDEFKELNADLLYDRGAAQPERKISLINPKILITGMVLGLLIVLFGAINPNTILSSVPQLLVISIGVLMCGVCIGLLVSSHLNRPYYDHTTEYEAALRQATLSNDDSIFAETLVRQSSLNCLAKYGCSDGAAFERFVQESREINDQVEHLQFLLKQVTDQLQMMQKEYTALLTQYEEDQQLIIDALSQSGVGSIEEYGEHCKRNDTADAIMIRLEAATDLYKTYETQVEALTSERRYYNGDELKEINRLLALKKEIQTEMDGLKAENRAYEQKKPDPVAIRERIEVLKKTAQSYSEDLEACERVERFFMNYAHQLHSHSVPDLNQKISEIIEKITGRYHEIHVDAQMNIRVADPETGSLLSLDQLSGGTIDQISLALRFGVADLVDEDQSMPLFLDDPFAQYDAERKEAAVSYLSAVSPVKQVLLFTCSIDEKRILDRSKCRYAGIGL